MNDFIETLDIDFWVIMGNGYNPPLKVENGIPILKPENS